MNISVLASNILAFNKLLNISVIRRTKKSETSKKCGTLTESKEIICNFCNKIFLKSKLLLFGKDFITEA